MKLIEIPEDINDITDLSVFKDTIKEINIFTRNLEMFAAKVSYKFINHPLGWSQTLSPEDFQNCGLRLSDIKNYKNHNNPKWSYEYNNSKGLYIYDFKNKLMYRLVPPALIHSFGDSRNSKISYNFNDDASVIIVSFTWETQESRFAHSPWKYNENTFYLDYINETILTKEEFSKRKTNKDTVNC